MGLYFWVKDILSRPAVGPVSRLLAAPLSGAGWAYGQAQALRRWAYRRGWLRSEHPGVPVVSVGNLTLGGTGKTPCVERICRVLQGMGRRPAVLSRGYGGSASRSGAVVGDGRRVLADWTVGGDEPVLLARRLPGVPVLVGRDRRRTARRAVRELGADALVLDDGFQHLRLARDLDVVTIDARNPFGNGACLPRGLLREGLRALADAGLVVLTRTRGLPRGRVAALRETVDRYAPGVPVLTAEHRPAGWIGADGERMLEVEALRGEKVLAFAGIGNPAAFFEDLEALGLRVVDSVPFPDHHRFTAEDLGRLAEWGRLVNASALVTTEKDLVRLPRDLPEGVPWLALRIELELRPEGVLEAALRRCIGAGRSCRGSAEREG